MVRKISYRTTDGKSRTLEYTLVRSARKSFGIDFNPDGIVTVRIPPHVTIRQAEEMLHRKLKWVLKHKQKFEETVKRTPTTKIENGSILLFLGKEHSLWVLVHAAAQDKVVKDGVYIHIHCKNEEQVKPLLQQWLHEQAKERFPAIIAPILERFKARYHVSPSKITIKWMKTRWGSCSSRRSISLNSRLIMASPRCIEQVFAHELCHLIHMNHSTDYYDTLSDFMPDWKERKRELKIITLEFRRYNF